MSCSGSEDSEVVSNGQAKPAFYQNVIVMRHGDRMDNFDNSWIDTATRPWDPPLCDGGLVRAFNTGRTSLNDLKYPIHRVFVSPFFRCVQTAAQVISGLSADQDASSGSNGSAVKVSIEYGLCEMLTDLAIEFKPENWDFNIPQLEAMFPIGSVDHSVERVYKEMLSWEGTADVTRRRYQQVFQTLADKYPTENLLLVTHGEGVGVVVSTFMENTKAYAVEYCAYAKLRRPAFRKGDEYTFENFEVRDVDLDGIKHMPVTEK